MGFVHGHLEFIDTVGFNSLIDQLVAFMGSGDQSVTEFCGLRKWDPVGASPLQHPNGLEFIEIEIVCSCSDWFCGLISERINLERERVLKCPFAYDRI